MEKAAGADRRLPTMAVIARMRAALRRCGPLVCVDAADLVQEALLRHFRLSRMLGTELPPAAAPAIARRVWSEALREQQRKRGRESGDAGLDGAEAHESMPDETTAEHDLHRAVEARLAPVLGARHWQVFRAVWLEGGSWRDAARRQGLPVAVGDAARRKVRRFLVEGRGHQSLEKWLHDLGIATPSTQNPEPSTQNPE